MDKYHDLLSWATFTAAAVGLFVGALLGNWWVVGFAGGYMVFWKAVQDFWR